MRILTNTLAFAPSTGIDTFAIQIGRELASRGHDICTLAQRDGDWRGEWEKFGTAIVCGDFLHPPFSPRNLRDRRTASWAKAIVSATAAGRRFRPDIVLVNDSSALMWARACAMGAAPIVCVLHNHLPGPLGLQRRLLARAVDRFVTPSAFLRGNWVGAGLPPYRVEVMIQALDPASFPVATPATRRDGRRDLQVADDAFVCAYVGRVVADKGVHVLAEAWRRMDLDPDEAQLVIVGQVWPSDYGTRLSNILTPGSWRYLLQQGDVLPILHAADILVVPSTWPEPAARSVLEAMSAGRPAVASAIGGLPELVPSNLADLLLVPPGDAAALAERLMTLRHWQLDRPDLGLQCRAHVEEHHTIAKMADDFERLFDHLVAGRNQRTVRQRHHTAASRAKSWWPGS